MYTNKPRTDNLKNQSVNQRIIETRYYINVIKKVESFSGQITIPQIYKYISSVSNR